MSKQGKEQNVDMSDVYGNRSLGNGILYPIPATSNYKFLNTTSNGKYVNTDKIVKIDKYGSYLKFGKEKMYF